MTSQFHLDHLKKLIARRQVICIIGTGVSISVSGNAPTASWTGLLGDGIAHCENVVPDLPEAWGKRARADLQSGDVDLMLAVAQVVSSKLGAPSGGEFKMWLRQSIGSLPLKHIEIIRALCDLGIPLATTNYDDLIEQVTGLPSVTWRDGSEVERVLRGDERAILHLHGHWKDSESVILSTSSYERVLGDAHSQIVLRAIRMFSNLLFVGVAQGLSDPNFSSFLRWTRQVFAGSEYRQYLLTRTEDVASLQREHPREERLFALSYGTAFSDLASFLRSLRPSPGRGSGEARVDAPAAGEKTRRPLPSPYCFGRDQVVESVVSTLLLDAPPPVPILGPPGIGKSTVTLAALHNKQVADRFKERRYFVRCEGAKSTEALIVDIALVVGVKLGPDLRGRLYADLEISPVLLVLDNLETTWEADRAATEALLSELVVISHLALVVSVRGGERPFGPRWRESIYLLPLEEENAQELFLAVAGEKFHHDPLMPDLVSALDGVPIAVELIAYASQAEPDLRGIRLQWERKRTSLLRRAEGQDPITNIEFSFELSITGRRMTQEARQLLFVMGLMPDGVAREDLEELMPENGEEAAATLRRVGLAFDEGGRLRLLAPLREYVRRQHEPDTEVIDRVMSHYLDMVMKYGGKVGEIEGGDAIKRLARDIGNIEAVIMRGLAQGDSFLSIRAALTLGIFQRYAGYGTTTILEKARETARIRQDGSLEASCVNELGALAQYRSNHEEARRFYEEALSLYEPLGDMLGKATSIRGLADIAHLHSSDKEAQQLYEKALPLYRRTGNELGEANCLLGLGDIAHARSNHEEAHQHYSRALLLFRRILFRRGQANCIRRLGSLAYDQSNYDEAHQHFEQALSLYDGLGDIKGEANCILGLGDIANIRSNYEEALQMYEEALSLYRRISNLRGEANCIERLQVWPFSSWVGR